MFVNWWKSSSITNKIVVDIDLHIYINIPPWDLKNKKSRTLYYINFNVILINVWYKFPVEWVLSNANYKSVLLTKFICMGTKRDWRMSEQIRCNSGVRVVSQNRVNCLFKMYIDGLVQDCSNSSALAL